MKAIVSCWASTTSELWDWAARQGCTRSNGTTATNSTRILCKRQEMADLHARIFLLVVSASVKDLGEVFPRRWITAQLAEATTTTPTRKPALPGAGSHRCGMPGRQSCLPRLLEQPPRTSQDAQLRQDPSPRVAEPRDRWQAANKATEDREKGKAIPACLRDRQLAEPARSVRSLNKWKMPWAEGNNVAVSGIRRLTECTVRAVEGRAPRFIRGTKGRAEEQARVETIEKFQDGRQIRLVLCNTDVGGESINLQGKSTAVADQPERQRPQNDPSVWAGAVMGVSFPFSV